jgi:hypothetical protein
VSVINRRGFLKRLAASSTAVAGAFAIDPERLLWVPGAKTIFLPAEKPLITGAAEVAKAYQDIRQRPIEDVLQEAGTHRFWMHKWTGETSQEPRVDPDWIDVEVDSCLCIF